MCLAIFTCLYLIYVFNVTKVFANSNEGGLECYHMPPEECPPLIDNLPRCKRKDLAVYCCHIHTENQLLEGLRATEKPNEHITALHIRNISLIRLEVNIPQWKSLISLSITDGNISQIMSILESQQIKCLNLSSNSISEIDPHLISKLTSLVRLDLSNNNIALLPPLSDNLMTFQINLSNNKLVNCSNILDMIKQIPLTHLHFDNRNHTVCSTYKNDEKLKMMSRDGYWIQPLYQYELGEVELMAKIVAECPQGDGWKCQCFPFPFPSKNESDKKRKIVASVDCSNRNLKELPRKLPNDSLVLDVNNNNISSLEALTNESSYENLVTLYADNNAIESIDILEGSGFINQFTLLSLKQNRITVIPTYILTNVFTRRSPTVRLGYNKLMCDCNTAQVLKVWLLNNKHHILDVNDLLCSNFKEPVLRLDSRQVCITPTDWTDYIYYIIASEILFFFLLLGKVSYDYWIFKTAGYLPWPASKMPKMPCDWVFET